MPSLDAEYEAQRKARRKLRILFMALIGIVLFFLFFVWGRTEKSDILPIKNAVAVIKGPIVEGTVRFSQPSPNAPVKVTGELRNLTPNALRGFHIHEFGDATNGCLSAGAHYNPENQNHGAPWDSVRHVGDLGNVRSNASGVATVDISDDKISLNGRFSILGRSVVVHEGTDDLGRGNNLESLKTGNADGRAGCAVIGIAAN